jgi:hypothetical protein
MLLNIDVPLRTATLHDEACSYVPKPFGTHFKPVGALGRDGGWFPVSSTAEAKAVASREYRQATFKACTFCQVS